MSNPSYVPRHFVVPAYDFGQREDVQWREPDEAWTARKVAQLEASRLQHRICFGVAQLYMPQSDFTKYTKLAEALDVPYGPLYKKLTGHAVMKLEDIGRLRRHIGPRLDYWLLGTQTASSVRLIEKQLHEAHLQRATQRH